jgi:hypothetical protein
MHVAGSFTSLDRERLEPNARLQELIQLNKTQYPEAFAR